MLANHIAPHLLLQPPNLTEVSAQTYKFFSSGATFGEIMHNFLLSVPLIWVLIANLKPSMSSSTKMDGGIEISFQDDRHYRHLTLPNKLTVMLIQDETTDKAAAALDVNAGYLLDPEYAPGLAHFCEHMLFMGTEKYPDENDYSSYLTSHGGSDNAYTSLEHTNYFFDVSHDYLEGALDRFAQFFISPLFAEGSTYREMQAVDAENSKNLQNDAWRFNQLFSSFMKKDHPGHKFGTGNLNTLGDMPEAAGKDIREELLAFHSAHYSANLMGLVVVGRESLDQLQAWVEAKFSDIPNKDLPTPSFPSDPFPPSSLGVEVHTVPIMDLREVTLVWPVPAQEPLYRTKPSAYAAALIGHEGAGSIVSLLKARGWANYLAAYLEDNSSWGSFCVQIEVTEKGFAALHEVVGVVYEYIAMLQREGPQARVWEELKTERDNGFRFKSKEDAASYAMSLAPNLAKVPAQHVVSADRLLFDYDPASINDFISRLTPERAMLNVVSQSFAQEDGLQQEEWYKTEYSVRPLSDSLLQPWAAPPTPLTPELKLPLPNDLLPTDFSLRPHTGPGDAPTREQTDVGGSAYAPVVLKDTPLTRLWFKQDLWFEKPKVKVRVSVNTPVANESPEAAVYSDLFLRLVQEELSEYAYMAGVGGMSYVTDASKEGLILAFSGFSQKMGLFVDRVVATLGSFKLEPRHEEAFDRLTDAIRQDLQNFQKQQPYEHAVFERRSATQLPVWKPQQKLGGVDAASMDGLRAFLVRLLSQAHCEVLVHGNANSQDALQLMESIERGLRVGPLLPDRRAVTRVVALAPATTYVRAVPEPNPEDPNSAIEVVFDVGGEDVERVAALTLMTQIAKEPAFNQLRTVEQLGYLVWSGASLSNGVYCFYVMLQSSKRDPVYLDGRVENFLRLFRSQLVALSDEDFATHRAAAMALVAEKDKSMGSETGRHWSEIQKGSYRFNRATEEEAALAQVTPEALLAFFDRYIAAGGERRTKFSSQVFSASHGAPPAHPTSANAMSPPATPTKCHPAAAKPPSDRVGKLSAGSGKGPAGRIAALSLRHESAPSKEDCGVGGEDGGDAMGLRGAGGEAAAPAASPHIVYVNDVTEFKRQMPLRAVKPLAPPTSSSASKF